MSAVKSDSVECILLLKGMCAKLPNSPYVGSVLDHRFHITLLGDPRSPTMSDSSAPFSSFEEAASDRESQETKEDFSEMCARAVVRLCTRHHYDMLLDNSHSQRSASGINGVAPSTMDPSKLPVALQNTLHKEINLMKKKNWKIPLLPNDAFIVRRSTPEELSEPEEAA